MKTRLKAIFITISILIVIFFVGFAGINILMKIVVGHGNDVEVPDLVGMNFNVAVKRCDNIKLYLEQKENVHNNDFEKGQIISQEPHPSILTKKYRTVKVIVSEGPEMVRIPYLYNLSAIEAKLMLESAGLQLGEKRYRYSDLVEKDKVIYSEPMADDLIAKKSEVAVAISLGKLENSSSSDKWRNLLDNE